MTTRKTVKIEPDRPGTTTDMRAPGMWIGYGALRATCPFCDDIGFFEPEDDVHEDFKICPHLVKAEKGEAIFEGEEDDSLFDFAADLMRLNAEGHK